MTASVLVVGGGGREHALAWKLAQSEHVAAVFVCPGNGGTHQRGKISNVCKKLIQYPMLSGYYPKTS